jgi:predicted lipoprotein with Yx(FWY)xxD motif
MRKRSLLLAAAALVTLFTVVSVAGAAQSRTVVKVGKSSLGRMLVDANGRTLYLFEKDKNGKSACTGTCKSFWPPVMAKGKPRAGAGVKSSLLGTTRRSDGGVQVTYRGHPLYRFALDKKAGQTKGEGLEDFGAHWYAVSPSGSKLTNGTSSGGSNGGGGYGGGYGGGW